MPQLTPFAIFITVLCLYIIKRIFKSSSSLPLPPGPRPLPIIGNVHQAPRSHAWKQFHTWGKEYGPIFHLNMLGQPVIVLSTSAAAHELLARRGATFSDRPRLFLGGELALKGLNTLLMSYDERFRQHQKLENSVLNQKAASTYIPFQALESKQLLLDLLQSGGGSGTDCRPHFERTAASTLLALFYGFRLETAEDPALLAEISLTEDFSEFVQAGAHIVDTFPILNNLPSFLAPWKAKAESHWARQRALHIGNFQRGLDTSNWTFAKHLHKAVQDGDISMQVDELALELGTIIGAALDGTTETVMWFVVACVTQNRGFIVRAQKDLDIVVGRNRLPNFEDKPKLTYISAIVEEILRWRPAGAGGVPHFTKTENNYEGYRIPAGSIIIPNHWAITREEKVFGPDVDQFIPERWMEQESPKTGVLKDLPVVGFGYGRRTCPGRHLARNFVWMAIAQLLWAFDIEAGLSEETGQPEYIDAEASTDGLAMRPLPFKALFKLRGPWVRDIIMRECGTLDSDFTSLLNRIGDEIQSQSHKDKKVSP
ncbi:putative cytochrome P450 [Daldinia sp. FL1419]|nr:putative cytochrome P450 [Daldinia sp. FL1419]